MKKVYAVLFLATLIVLSISALYLGLRTQPSIEADRQPSSSLEYGNVSAPVVTPRSPKIEPDTPEFEKLRKNRLEKLHDFDTQAYKIVKKTQDKEGIAVWDFMVKNGRPAFATADNYTIHDTTPGEHVFDIAVITAEDAKLGEPWASSWKVRNEIVAHYEAGKERNIVILPDTQFGGFVRGLFYLHELRHARSHNTTIVPDTVEGAVSEELPAYAMQDRLARKMAGELFERMLKEEIANVVVQMNGVPPANFRERAEAVHYRYSLSDMPQAFPGLCRPGDEQFCYSMFNRLTIWGALDQLYPPADATTIKRSVVETLVRIANKLPK